MTDARTITRELGGRWCGSYGIAKCPAHDDKNPSLSIRDGEQELIVNCFAGCDWQDVKAEFRRFGLLGDEIEPRRCPRTAKAPAPGTILSPKLDAGTAHHGDIGDHGGIGRDHHDIGDHGGLGNERLALRIWAEAEPLRSPASSRLNTFTLGWRYLTERRGLHVGILDDLSHALRWHGAVVALMTDPLTGKPTGVHRTFLNPDATKIERKMLGRQGVIRLSPDEEATLGLGLTEGVEDGLAVLLSGWAPVWAASCASAIERFPVLPGIEALTIFHDRDNVGKRAAEVCAERWASAGREVFLA